MKVWIKYLTGAFIGIFLGFIFTNFFANENFFRIINGVIINIGKYTFFPLAFFSVSIGISRLIYSKMIFRLFGKTIVMTIAVSAILSLLGGISALYIFNDRIPVLNNMLLSSAIEFPSLAQHLLMIFPDNFFDIFFSSADYLLPLFLLAALIGINIHLNTIISSRPVVQILDSMDRIFFEINNLFIEFIIPFGIMFLSANMTAVLISNGYLSLFNYLFITLAADTIIVIFIILPAFVYFLCKREINPYKCMYAMTATAISSFFSGNLYFGACTLIKASFENLGIKRKVSSSVISFMSIFSRGGAAMVATVVFITVVRSYTELEIPASTAWEIILFSFLLSFIIGSVPKYSVMIIVILLCRWYGHGIQDGYTIMVPAMFIFLSFSTLIDVFIMGFVTTIIAHQEKQMTEKPAAKFS